MREIRFLTPLSLSVLGQHRIVEPYGMAGGGNGLPGRVTLLRSAVSRRRWPRSTSVKSRLAIA